MPSCNSLKFKDQKKAWQSIFDKIKKVKPNSEIATIISDAGPENRNKDIEAFFTNLKIKVNLVQTRPFRMSKGATAIESAIRRIRKNLESVISNKKKRTNFKETLLMVEKMCNNQVLSSIKMSPNEALRHKPEYILLMSQSNKYRKRKHLRTELNDQVEIPMFTIVQIKKFQQKQFTSVRKESYGHVSSYFIVVEILKDREIFTYKVAELFTFNKLPGSYSKAELKIPTISYIEACSKEQSIIHKIVKKKGNLIFYKNPFSNDTHVANITLLDN